MTIRRSTLFLIMTIAAAAIVSCSPTTKHRVLSFFLDGVPEPGATPSKGHPPLPGRFGAPPVVPNVGAAPVVMFAHAPYRENKCGACHEGLTGELLKKPQEGLCRGCHPGVPGDARFAHGPVAVQDCLLCHHYHGSIHPKLLLIEPPALCLQCHDETDLGQGSHHENAAQSSCTQCHGGHGGDDRYFLKRTQP